MNWVGPVNWCLLVQAVNHAIYSTDTKYNYAIVCQGLHSSPE